MGAGWKSYEGCTGVPSTAALHACVQTGYIDYDKLEEKALDFRPKMLICGGSAYPREWDYKRLYEIAQRVGALLMSDMAHIRCGAWHRQAAEVPWVMCLPCRQPWTASAHAGCSWDTGPWNVSFSAPQAYLTADSRTPTMHRSRRAGAAPRTRLLPGHGRGGPRRLIRLHACSGLVAAQEAAQPFEYCDVVTTTTHKSLRGPRAGMIFFRMVCGPGCAPAAESGRRLLCTCCRLRLLHVPPARTPGSFLACGMRDALYASAAEHASALARPRHLV